MNFAKSHSAARLSWVAKTRGFPSLRHRRFGFFCLVLGTVRDFNKLIQSRLSPREQAPRWMQSVITRAPFGLEPGNNPAALRACDLAARPGFAAMADCRPRRLDRGAMGCTMMIVSVRGVPALANDGFALGGAAV